MPKIQFTKTKIKLNKRNATVSIPLGLAKELYGDTTEQEGFITVINGVIQISSKKPDVVIPTMVLEKEYFVPQAN